MCIILAFACIMTEVKWKKSRKIYGLHRITCSIHIHILYVNLLKVNVSYMWRHANSSTAEWQIYATRCSCNFNWAW